MAKQTLSLSFDSRRQVLLTDMIGIMKERSSSHFVKAVRKEIQ